VSPGREPDRRRLLDAGGTPREREGLDAFPTGGVRTIGLSLANEDLGMPDLSENRKAMGSLLEALAGATGGQFRVILKVPKKG
jgi:hypothetical protein